MHFVKSFFSRIVKDLKQKKLIPLKVLFFVHASTLFVLYPYLTIHMRELGINVEETAIMSAVTPVISIVMPPLAGMLADKVGNFRLLLAVSSSLGGLAGLLLLVVPVGRIMVTFPPATEMILSCDDGALRLQQVHDHPCQSLHLHPYSINLTVLSCGFQCELPELSREEKEVIFNSQSYEINLQSTAGQRLVYRHTMSPFLTKSNMSMKDQSSSRILINNPYFNTSISKLSDSRIFFPTPKLFGFDCNEKLDNSTCSFGKNDIFNETSVADEALYNALVSTDEYKMLHDLENTRSFAINYIFKGMLLAELNNIYNNSESTTCSDNMNQKVHVNVGSKRIAQCSAACSAITPRKSICSNKKQQIEFDPVFTFWTYLIVRVFIGIIGGTAFAMFEGAVIAILREQSADYGLQRMYGSIGGMISSPLSGMLIDYASRGKGYTDFRPAFYLYAVLKVGSGALMMGIDLEFKQPAQNLLKDVIAVLKNIEIVALFIACFIMGTAWGYIESFLFWLLQDMGASRSLMGITITVGGIAGLPLLVLSGPIIKKLGHANVLFIGFVFYAIRLLGYSLVYNPWLCLIFEALESVTSSLSFTAAVTYAARLSSTTTDTSVQGLLGGIYYGVGKGFGSLIGGYLMKYFGTRPTYQIFAAATFITGCIYFLFNNLFIRKRAADDTNDICKKKPVVDVESHEPKKDIEKVIAPVEDANKNDLKLTNVENVTVLTADVRRSITDNLDGSSDSGFDNPAFSETEISECSANTKDDKVTGQ